MSTKNTNEGANENFSWDTEVEDIEFFGTGGKAVTPVKPQTVAEIVKQVVTEEDDFEEETEEVTTIEEKKKPAKVKGKAKSEEAEIDFEEEGEVEEADFTFGAPKKEEPKKKPDATPKKEDKSKVKPETEDAEEGDEEEEDEDKVPHNPKPEGEEEEVSDGKFFMTQAKEMIERGKFHHAKLPEGKEELSEDEYFDLNDQEIEGRVQETFEAFFEELDEEGIDFLKFKRDGGKSADFISVYGSSPVPDFDDGYNPEDEGHRQEVIESYLFIVDKMDAEEVKDRLEWLKENGKEKAYADKYYNKLVEIDTAQKTALLEGQKQAAKKREADTKKFNAALFELLDKTEQVGQIKITKEDKKKLGGFFTKPSVRVGKNKYVPEFNFKLGQILKAETPEAKQTLLLLGKLVENNFDFSDLLTKAETKVAKAVKSKLRDSKNGVKPSSSGNYTKRSLSDFFNE